MAASLDYERLRQQTMTTGEDAAVTVNTRALIDKVLARYSSEFTTLRELVQNGADAGATKVTIKFETSPSVDVPAPQSTESHIRLQHTIKHHAVSNLVVTNNGQAFSPSDWARLKSIAEGNPDETKIGAFGVGFYSVFADCDEPFVISGTSTMAFFWKGNTLYTRSGQLPEGQKSPVTSFSLPYRNFSSSSGATGSSPVPDLLALCQFLSTSLTFVGLEQIELSIDEWSISTFRKMSSPPNDFPLPSDFKPTTDGGIMTLRNVSSQTAQIDATWSNVIGWVRDPRKEASFKPRAEEIIGSGLKSFWSRLTIGSEPSKGTQKKAAVQPDKITVPTKSEESTAGTSNATVFIRVHTLHVQTKVSSSFSRELERATKKPPPKTTRVSVLTSPFDEASASLITKEGQTSKLASKLFSSVLPTSSGRIFIGFPTGQTTGPLCHISMPSIIPTVERESIDLNAKHIGTWNSELLQVAGIGCRLAFYAEMKNLQNKAGRLVDSKEPIAAVVAKSIPEANHIFKQFTFMESTPSSRVGAIIEQAFWTCTRQDRRSSSMLLLSSQGILPNSKVRITAEKLSFLGSFPVVPDGIVESSSEFMQSLVSNGLLSQMTVEDIRQELETRALTEEELVEFLKWCGTKVSEQRFTTSEIQALFKSTVADVAGTSGVLLLSSIKTFLNTARISPDMPLPSFNAPFAATQSIAMPQLRSFGWEELQVVPWLEHVVSEAISGRISEQQNLMKTPEFASRVLNIVSKAWEQLNPTSKARVIDLLSHHSTMPTTQGLKKPGESYMPSVKGFSNLAIMASTGLKPKFLTALGVRTTVELSVAFQGLESVGTSKGHPVAPKGWNHEQILKYFGSVLDEIPKGDIERLKTIPFCLSEKDGNNYLWKVSDLYAPSEGIHRIRLPTIRLHAYRPDSQEGKLLTRLGLIPHPTASTLIACLRQAATTKEPSYKDYINVMSYFVNNFVNNGYDRLDMSQFSQTPYLISKQQPFPTLVAPASIFSNEQAEILRMKTIHDDLSPHAEKFGVSPHPPALMCVQTLISQPPKSLHEASQMFAYMASRLTERDRELLVTLSEADIVPIFIAVGKDGSRKPVNTQHSASRLSSNWQVVLSSMKAPSDVFIGKDQEYKDLLTYVDFGEQANLFLLKAGSKHEPSSMELVRIVANDPGKFLRSVGVERYLELLRKFAENQDGIAKDGPLFKKLQRTPLLLALQDKVSENKEVSLIDLDEDEDVNIQMDWSLQIAADVVVNDDVRQYDLFRQYVKLVPQEDNLEKFYLALGAKCLSGLITTRIRQGPQIHNQERAQALLKEIISRSQIFLYEHEKEGSKNIRHNSKWLRQNLKVIEIEHVVIEHTLTSTSVKRKETKTAHYTRQDGVLRITGNIDMYDIGRELVPLLILRPKQYEFMAFERIMTEPLRRLQKKGYNVDRILRQKEVEATVRESERQKHFEAEKVRQESMAANNPPPQEQPEPRRSIDKSEQMPGAFGSDSPQRPSTGDSDAALSKAVRKTGNNIFNRFRDNFINFTNPDPRPSGPSNDPLSTSTRDTTRNPTAQQASSDSQVASAVSRTRAHSAQNVDSASHTRDIDVAPESYCDSNAAHNLVALPDDTVGASGIRCFAAREFDPALLTTVRASRGAFAEVLVRLANIFGLDVTHCHIFYDNHSNTIAFNLNGALFFNCWYFHSLHRGMGKNVAVWDYWYLVACHEIAHNLVKEHSANHEYLLQEVCLKYRARFYEAVFASGKGLEGRGEMEGIMGPPL